METFWELESESFKQRLDAVRSIEQIRLLRLELRTEVMDPLEFSRRAFETLLAHASGAQQLAFLEDPHLNIPESRNLTTLITAYTQPNLRRRLPRPCFSAHRFMNTLYKLISLGSVLPGELLHIIETAESFVLAHREHIANNAKGNFKLHDSPQKVVINCYKWIFRGMVACRVTPVNMDAVHSLYAKIPAPERSQDVAAMDETPLALDSCPSRVLNEKRLAKEITPLHVLEQDVSSSNQKISYEQKLALRLRFKLGQFIWPLKGHEGPEFPPLDRLLEAWVADVARLEQLQAHTDQGYALRLNRERLIAHLDAIGPHEEEAIYSATSLLMKQRPPSPSANDEYRTWQCKLYIWLSCLRSSFRFKSQIIPDDSIKDGWQLTYRARGVWRRIYEILAPNTTLTDLAPLFSSLHPLDVSRIMLEIYMHGNKNLTNSKRGEREHGVLVNITRVMGLRLALEKLNLQVYSEEGSNRSTQLICNLFAVLAENGLPYRFFMTDIFEFIRQTRGSITPLLKLIHALFRQRIETYPQPIQKTIEELVHENPLVAYKLFRARPIWLSSIPELPIELAKRGIHSRIIFNLLKYEDPTRLPNLRQKEKRNPAAFLRVKLVHLIADTMSRHPSSRSRVVFRDVYRCYNYLHDRGYSIGPLISRALARAGVVLPLQRGEDIPTSRFVWILGMVRTLEGEEVAKQLDTIAFRWRERVRTDRTARRVELRRQGLPTSDVDIKNGGSPGQHSKGYNVWSRPYRRKVGKSLRSSTALRTPRGTFYTHSAKPGQDVFHLKLLSEEATSVGLRPDLLAESTDAEGMSSLGISEGLCTSLGKDLNSVLTKWKSKRKSGRLNKAFTTTSPASTLQLARTVEPIDTEDMRSGKRHLARQVGPMQVGKMRANFTTQPFQPVKAAASWKVKDSAAYADALSGLEDTLSESTPAKKRVSGRRRE
jgi:hypothetical protein